MRIERFVVTLVGAAIVSPIAFVLLRAVGLPLGVAGLGAAMLLGAALAWVPGRLPASLDGIARSHRVVCLLWLAVAGGAVVQNARLCAFELDPWAFKSAVIPRKGFFVQHNCMTAYVAAAQWSRTQVTNLYDVVHYKVPPAGDGPVFTPFDTDLYQYPPPFLLLPRIGLAFTDSVFTLRAVWFVVEATTTLLALLMIARFVGGREGKRALLLVPLVWVAVPTLQSLQFGNFQIMTIVLSILAMLAFEAKRGAVGGALLAFVTLSKIFPGLLILYLVFRREWRAVAWTGALCVFYVLVGLAVLGRAPFEAFVHYQVPRLASGEAFPMLTSTVPVAQNHSIFGIVVKLGHVGVPGMTRALASGVNWVFTAILFGVTFLAARRVPTRLARAQIWLALLQLGSLRSPFTPNHYALFAPVWLLTLFLAEPHEKRGSATILAGAVGSFCIMQVILPAEVGTAAQTVLFHAVPQVVELAVTVYVLSRALRSAPALPSPGLRVAHVAAAPAVGAGLI